MPQKHQSQQHIPTMTITQAAPSAFADAMYNAASAAYQSSLPMRSSFTATTQETKAEER